MFGRFVESVEARVRALFTLLYVPVRTLARLGVQIEFAT